jgi:hypothetical protein
VFGGNDNRSVLLSSSESFLANNFDRLSILRAFFSSSKRLTFRRFCLSRDRTCPFSTLDAIERRVFCTRLSLASSPPFGCPGKGLYLSSKLEGLIWPCTKNGSVHSAAEKADDLELIASLSVRTFVEISRNNVSRWRLHESRNITECSPFLSSRTVEFSPAVSLALSGRTCTGV